MGNARHTRGSEDVDVDENPTFSGPFSGRPSQQPISALLKKDYFTRCKLFHEVNLSNFFLNMPDPDPDFRTNFYNCH